MAENSIDQQQADRTVHSADTTERAEGLLPDEFRFLSFARRYVGLLTGIAALPLLLSLLDVLPPPSSDGGHKLELLASFLCVVIFGATFLLRSFLNWFLVNRNPLVKTAPFVLVVLVLAAGIYFTALYLEQPPTGRSSAGSPCSPALYLAIYPTFVLSLGLVLVSAFLQQEEFSIQNLVQTRLSPSDRHLVLELLEYFAQFRVISEGRLELQEVAEEILGPSKLQIRDLARGHVTVPGSRAVDIQGILLDRFQKSFDAVSERDLEFWKGDNEPALARKYFRLCENAVAIGTSVTRIFLLDDKELDDLDGITSVLTRHQEVGMGWAIVPFGELHHSILEDPNVALDFALYDQDQAVSYFSGYHEASRKYTARFGTAYTRERVTEQVKQYDRIFSHCWVVSELFAAAHVARIERRAKLMAELHALLLKRVGEPIPSEGGPFVRVVSTPEEIGEAVEQIQDLRRRSRDWYPGEQ